MNLLSKIDEFIDQIEERKNRIDYTSEYLQELGLESDVIERLMEAMKQKDDYKPSEYLNGKRKVGGKEYDDFFKSMLKKWKIKSYKDLPKNKQDDFFNDVDKGWNSKKEKKK
jgi:hypothetical protein